MERLQDRHGAETTLGALRHLMIRLARQPETASLREAVAAVRGPLTATHETWLEAHEARVAASGELGYLDTLAGDEIRGIARDQLAHVEGQRDAADFKVLIPRPVAELVSGVASVAEGRYIRGLVARILEDDTFAHLRERARRLAGYQDRIDAAIRQRETLYGAEAKAAGDRQKVLDQAKRVYNLLPAQLLLLFPDDAALVESFFPVIAKRTAPAEPATPEG